MMDKTSQTFDTHIKDMVPFLLVAFPELEGNCYFTVSNNRQKKMETHKNPHWPAHRIGELLLQGLPSPAF